MFRNTLISFTLSMSFLFIFNVNTAIAQMTGSPGNGGQNLTGQDWVNRCCLGACETEMCRPGESSEYSCNVILNNMLRVENLANIADIDFVQVPQVFGMNQNISYTMITLSECNGCTSVLGSLPVYPAWLEGITVIVGRTDGYLYTFEVDLP